MYQSQLPIFYIHAMKIESAIVCRFNFLCREQWENLTTVPSNLRVRHCSACDSHVYLTETYDELAQNIAKRRCVAIRIQRNNGPDLEMLGDVAEFDSETHQSLTQAVEVLNLSTHIVKKLKACDLNKIGDLVVCTEDQLLRLLSNDTSFLNEIKESLALFGLRINMRN